MIADGPVNLRSSLGSRSYHPNNPYFRPSSRSTPRRFIGSSRGLTIATIVSMPFPINPNIRFEGGGKKWRDISGERKSISSCYRLLP